MPFLSPEEVGQNLLDEAETFRSDADPDIEFGEAFAASFFQDNTIGSIIASNTLFRNFGERDPEYDPRRGKDGTVYQYHLSRFAYAQNDEEDQAIRTQIDEELERRSIIQQAGSTGTVAGLLNGVLDITNILPGGIAIRGFNTVRRLSSIAIPAVETALAGAFSAGVSETILQATQETRTTQETVTNIAASTILSGALGGAAAAWGVSRYRSNLTSMNSELDPTQSVNIDLGTGETISVSSASRDELQNLIVGSDGTMRMTTLEEEGVAKEGRWFANLISPMVPILRVLKSESIEARRLIQDVAEMPFALMKNVKGVSTRFSAESEAGLFSGIRATADNEYNKIYETYRMGVDPGLIASGKKLLGDVGTPKGVLTEAEFSDRVGLALRRGDRDISLNSDPNFSPVSEVEKAAKAYRKFFNEGKKRMIDSGLVKQEDIGTTTAESYFMRVYDKQKMFDPDVEIRMTREFSNWLTEIRDKRILDKPENITSRNTSKKELTQRNIELKELKKSKAPQEDIDILQGNIFKIEDQITELNRDIRGADRGDDWMEERAGEIYQRIRSSGDTRLEYEMDIDSNNLQSSGVGTRGPAKRRDFLIPDERIADILVNDVREIVKMYDRTVGIDAAIYKRFGTFNLISDRDGKVGAESSAARKITKQYQEKQQKVREEGGSGKDIEKLEDQKDSDLRTLQAIVDRLRGVVEQNASNSGWQRVGALARSWNYIRLLGGMTPSALPDVGNIIMKEGLRPLFGDALTKFATDLKGTRMARDELEIIGLGLDDVNRGRSALLEGVNASNRKGQTFVENGVHGLARGFSKVALMTQWNNKVKQIAGMTVQARMMRSFQKNWGQLSIRDRNKLARSGIGENGFEAIKRNLKGNIEQRESGILLPNTSNWNEPDADFARSLFRGAILRDVNIMIVTPGQEIPIWMSSEAGKFFTQFKSFAVSSTSRTMLTALQDKDMNTIMGIMTSVGLGTVSYVVKQKAADKEVDLSIDNLLKEGVDRSGVLGVLPEMNGALEKMNIGFGRWTGGKQLSRFASRNVLGQIAGPSSGLLQDVTQTISSLASEGVLKKSDTAAMKRLLPYQNLIYIRFLLEKAKDGIDNSLGIRK